MTIVDVNTFLGAYPYRQTPAWDATDLTREMLRIGASECWVSNLPAIIWRDPASGNAALYEAHERDTRLRPVPAVHPGNPMWERVIDEAVREGAAAVRCDPLHYGIAPAGDEVRALASACAERGVPLLLAVRLEDQRQRHPHDHAGELPAAAVRQLIRLHPALQLVITHADREFVEQVHFGSTPGEAARILWDICWIWGPPEDHLELLLQTVGVDRFTFGTGMPMRLAETTLAKLDLLNLASEHREAIGSGNLAAFLGAGS